MVGDRTRLVRDSKLVSRYASETGVPVEKLRLELAKAEAELAAGSLSAKTEQDLLEAQGEAIAKVKALNLDEIEGWYSIGNMIWGFINRSFAFLIVIFCLMNIIPLTFLYSDVNTRVGNIAALCGNGSTDSSGQDLQKYLKQCLEWSYDRRRIDDNINSISGGADILADLQKHNMPESSPESFSVKLFATPPAAMLMMDFGFQQAASWLPGVTKSWSIISNPVDDSEFDPAVRGTPGLVLYRAAHDFGLVVYVLGSGYLPMLYGMLGASVFLLRRSLSNDPADYLMVTSGVQTFMRVGLGGVAGIVVGWFNFPNTSEVTTLASTQFALAFLAGFSIDIVFALLDRMVSVFDFKRAT